MIQGKLILNRYVKVKITAAPCFCLNKNANSRWKEGKVNYIPEFHAQLYCLIVKLESLL